MRERVEEMAHRHDPRTGQTDRPVSIGNLAWMRNHGMGCAGRPPRLRPHHPERARHAAFRAASTDRRGRCVLAVELSHEFAGPQGRGALAAGCSIILKASEETPAGAVQLVQAFHDAGLPPGVLNLVFGKPSDISEYLIPQPSVRLVTFTGSVPVGKHLSAMAGAHMKPVIMELGGHSPVIVCDDVDPVSTAATSAIGKSRNAGQVCVSPTRFFVEDKIYDQFAASFAEKAAAMKVGNGLDPANQMGPLGQ